jgi:hypothetical protein
MLISGPSSSLFSSPTPTSLMHIALLDAPTLPSASHTSASAFIGSVSFGIIAAIAALGARPSCNIALPFAVVASVHALSFLGCVIYALELAGIQVTPAASLIGVMLPLSSSISTYIAANSFYHNKGRPAADHRPWSSESFWRYP